MNNSSEILNRRVLIVATHKYWPGISRLPQGLQRAGFSVFALCPVGSFLSKTRRLNGGHFYNTYTYSRTNLFYFWVIYSILKFKPEFLIPGDEEAIQIIMSLRNFFTKFFPKLRLTQELNNSVGSLQFTKLFLSKSEFVHQSMLWGVSVPESHTVKTIDEALKFSEAMNYPVVLKIDSGYGGAGVYICQNKAELIKSFSIEHKTKFKSLLKLYVKKIFFISVFSSESIISIQKFIDTDRGHCSFSAFKGKLLAANPMLVLKSHPGKTGPSSVCEGLDNAEIVAAIQKTVEETGYSGFGSFDFMYDIKNNKIYVIEFNCRPTPWAHYSDKIVPNDLCKALFCAMNNETYNLNPFKKYQIALFPNEQKRDPHSEYLKTAFHDVPEDDANLKRALLE